MDSAFIHFNFAFISPGALGERVYECRHCWALVMEQRVVAHHDGHRCH